jgi:hypothetical protein
MTSSRRVPGRPLSGPSSNRVARPCTADQAAYSASTRLPALSTPWVTSSSSVPVSSLNVANSPGSTMPPGSSVSQKQARNRPCSR